VDLIAEKKGGVWVVVVVVTFPRVVEEYKASRNINEA
jgi:hypothetical protein